MSIKSAIRLRGFTLIEVMVASALAGIVVTAMALLSFFTSRSFVAATNYADMALSSRMALDNMSRTIRQSHQVTEYTTNAIALLDVNSNTVRYSFDPNSKVLLSVTGTTTNKYLTGCNTLEFWLYQRTPVSNSFSCYTPAYLTNAKLVQVTWSCSRKIFGVNVNNEVVESASICLRNH